MRHKSVQPGYLSSGDLLLRQTVETRQALSKAARRHHAIRQLSQMPVVALAWNPPGSDQSASDASTASIST